ncbi:YoaH family protein [Providencia huaxiensis]|uniref:YoaH family protein n=1 Tax=Providencia TaxID=586 RepID=UPI001B373AB0|nr:MULTISPECIES: YoaH family protein [Providencia]EJD6370980.1 YoaH family protein [Providencia rettgeri]EJD6374942.1 YoaH family protein [Providencia rettgeri]ELR5033372.1 YoaH family protein [Providencia rettgeri]ELR5131301.1 YoaH family protein [Providencia rettgeri]ELR5159574.1 YoaH family protein [Providencia rettgeri]
MLSGIPALNHEEQQEAVERIHQLMAQGMSSGQAIAIVAQEIRESHQGKEQIHVLFDDEN